MLQLANSLHSLIIPQTTVLGSPASTGEALAKPKCAEENLKPSFPPSWQSWSHKATGCRCRGTQNRSESPDVNVVSPPLPSRKEAAFSPPSPEQITGLSV